MTPTHVPPLREDGASQGDRFASLGQLAQRTLQKQIKRIVKLEHDVYADRDPEALHQMRVGVRRLRTLVQVFQPVLRPQSTQMKELQWLARRLGALRDLDVLQTQVVQICPTHVPRSEQQRFQRTLKSLADQRHTALRHLRHTLKSKRYKHLKRSLQTWPHAAYGGPLAHLSIEQALPDVLQPALTKVLHHPGWLIGQDLAFTDRPWPCLSLREERSLHDLRKGLKQVRYQTEYLLAEFQPDLPSLGEVRSLQETLGQLQDGAVLRQMLAEVHGKHWMLRLPTVAQQLLRQEQAAWAVWRSRQADYLSPAFRQALRDLAQLPKPPICTSGMAGINGEDLAQQDLAQQGDKPDKDINKMLQ